MKLTFLGATGTVTGSKYLLTNDGENILVDCGLFQGYKELRLKNWASLPVSAKSIHTVLLTHAHIDHTGYLPLLVKHGFKGSIYASLATRDLCSILLPDSGYLQEEDARRANRYHYSKHHPALPLYTEDDARRVMKQFKVIDFEKTYGLNNTLSANWYRGSHILGAGFIRCQSKNASILFTGDLGRSNDPILKPPHSIVYADYLVIESTYGDRLHHKDNPADKLKSVINDTAKRGGTILIPSFAVGRAQLVLYHLYHLKKRGEIADIPIYLDSPMAIEATHIMQTHLADHKVSESECDNICQIAKYMLTQEDSKSISENQMPKIIIAASGMATGGRVLHHLKTYGPDHRNTILFTGYQAGGTRGARIVSGEKTIKIHGTDIHINAQVESLSNMSAHVDYEEMLTWLSRLDRPPKHVFITHGDGEATQSLQEKIIDKFGWSCSIPKYQDVETL